MAKETGDIYAYVKARAMGACDARMYGEPLPTWSVAGSGDHGIMCNMPLIAFAERTNTDEEKLLKAIALSTILTIYVAYNSSYISPTCGLASKVGIGATAGFTYLMTDGNPSAIKASVQNYIATVAGMICDGANAGCALKLGAVTDATLQSAFMAKEGCVVPHSEGILGETAEESIRNMAEVAIAPTGFDDFVIKILVNRLDKQ
jgi:L-cysteine desulfidase